MRALTVRQPWAWAIVHGGKDVENRTRNLAGTYRGPVAIHAGLAFEQHNQASDLHRALHSTEVTTELHFGAVIGLADLVDVHLETPTCCTSTWAQRVSRYDENPLHHLVLADPRPLAVPIPAKGRLGLWTPDADLLAQIDEQVPA